MTLLNFPHAVPRLILFDWHATLVDTHDAMYHAVDEILPKLQELGLFDRMISIRQSRTLEDAKLVRYVRQNRQLHPKIRQARKISRTDIFEVLFGSDQEAKDMAHRAFDAAYRTHCGSVTPLEPDVLSTLEGLRGLGIRLGLLSNRNREFVEQEIDALGERGWREHFDAIVCGDDVPRRKPHPDHIQAALRRLGEPAGLHCWYVGDSTTDVAAACKAEVAAVFYNGAGWTQGWIDRIFPGTVGYPYRPHAVVADLHELLQQARRLKAMAAERRGGAPEATGG